MVSPAATTENHALPRANVRSGRTPFPSSEFVTIPNVPVFAEHETKARDGRILRFRRKELQMIVDRCNRRIRETGDYAAMTLGHTPSPEQIEKGHKMPELVGFAGPFRIGVIGEPGERQRYAILADQHIFKEDVGKVKKHPRRSPELWLEDKYEEMFLDPIALLGAEAPRLDMGILYSAWRNRDARGPRRVELYTAACAPGPMNTYIPSHGDKKDYAAHPPGTKPPVGGVPAKPAPGAKPPAKTFGPPNFYPKTGPNAVKTDKPAIAPKPFTDTAQYGAMSDAMKKAGGAIKRGAENAWDHANDAAEVFLGSGQTGSNAAQRREQREKAEQSSGDGKKNYAAGSSPSNGAQAMLSPEDISQIVDSLMQTAPMQWVQSQMAAEQAPNAADGIEAGGLPAPGDMGGGEMGAPPPGMPGDPAAAGGPPGAGGMPAPPMEAPGSAAGGMPVDAGGGEEEGGEAPPVDDEDDKQQYSAMGTVGGNRADGQGPTAGSADPSGGGDASGSYSTQRGAPSKYSRSTATERIQYAKRLESLEHQLNVEREKRVDAERREAIMHERQVRSFDEVKMLERCKYSRMNDQQFNDTMEVLRETAAEIPLDIFVPSFDQEDVPLQRDRQQRGAEKYSMAHREKAMKLAEAESIRGGEPDYMAILADVAAGKR